MKKIFSFTKKKKHPSGTPDNGSVLSAGYELKDKDLGKVHKAASVGDLAKLKQLAKKNDINQLDKENRTALHIACAGGHVDVVQFLVESKAKLNLCDNQNRSALMKAVQGQHERCVSTLLENHAEPNLVDINGNTALHLAANIPSISTAVLLLEHEADINAQNKEGFVPLTVAVREDHIEMAEFLLKEGADVNLVDRDQRTPLMIAAGNGQINMLRLLLRFDADITLKDTKGWSADDYAGMNGHHPCSLLINEHSTHRNDGASLSFQGPTKKKKKTLAGSPSQDFEAGFSLGGPATDKDDFEDNSQSESLSRVSKSAGDEWPSSDDDNDESASIEKKPQKVNLRKLIASERGEASALPNRSLSGSESEPESENRVQRIPSFPQTLPPSKAPQHPVDPPPVSFLSKAPQMTSTPLQSYRKQKSKLSEQPSSSKRRPEPEAESPEPGDSEEEEDDDDEDYDDEEEEEEEEEEEDDEEEEEEEEEEESEEEDEEEEEEEDEENDDSIEANTTEFEGKPSVSDALKIIDGEDAPNLPDPDAGEIVHDSEKDADAETPADTNSYAIPTTLNIAEDCVVSAIRVESKFSDEDDSLGKENARPSGQSVNPDLTGGPIEEEEPEREDAKEDDDSWIDEDNSGETVWNDTEDEEDHKGRTTVLAKRMKPQPVDEEENTEGSVKDTEEGKRRSSWGSSLEDEEEKVEDQNSDVQTTDLQPGAEKQNSKAVSEEGVNNSWDSSPKCVSPQTAADKPLSPSGLSPLSTPKSKSRLVKTPKEESDWDSASESNKHADNVSVNKEEQPPVTDTNIEAVNQTEEQQGSDEESNKPSPAASPEPKDEETSRKQTLENEDVDPAGGTSETEEKRDSEHANDDDDDNWDNEDGGNELENQHHTSKSPKFSQTNTELEEEPGADPPEDEEKDEKDPQTVGDVDDDRETAQDANKDDEISEDSDSMDTKLQYDVATATVQKSDDEHEAQLIAYVPLESKPNVEGSHDDSSKDQIMELLSPPSKDEVAAGQPLDSDRSALADEDDDDGVADVEIVEEQARQKEEYTDDEDEKENEEDEEEGETSDENNQPEGSGESLEATLPAPETTAGSQSKKRDFLSELGLEKEEEELDSWDSESCSESPKRPHQEKQSVCSMDQEETCAAKEESKDAECREERVVQDEAVHKETEKMKWEPLNVLNKLQSDKEQKTDFLEELGLGDVDDLEDASDWDSASTTSKRTLPGRRMASPGLEEFPECTVKEEDEDVAPAALLTPSKTQPDTPPQSVPRPQPRARRMMLQKAESEDESESEWEPDNTNTVDNQLQTVAELQPTVTPASPELAPEVTDGNIDEESDGKHEKEKDSVDSCGLDVDSPCASGHVGPDDYRDQCSPEEKGEASEDVPWEKRYEKLWVEVEKREVKSTFKNVAHELKEKFGELLKSRSEDDAEHGERMADSSSSDEDEEGEIIVRPTARARSTVLLTIPEQRESGLEDSVTESTDDRMQERCERAASESSVCQDLLADDAQEDFRSPSPQRESTTTAFTNCDLVSRDEPKHQHVNRICTNGRAHHEEADPSLREESEECRRSTSILGVSDEELEEDVERFKLEVGMLKDVFLDLKKEKAQLQKEAVKETVRATMQEQKSISSWDSGGAALEESRSEKPESRLGSLSSPVGAIPPELQPETVKSSNKAPVHVQLPLQQTFSSIRQEGEAVEDPVQLELVRGARHCRAPQTRAPQTRTHVNGDPLSVFDDSTLSEVSDDEERLSTGGKQKNENPEEVEMAEDFDELTQSSDTATDDIDSPTSGYRHASLLIQKLDSATLDSRSMVKLQNIFHEYERSIQKARSRHGYLTDKVSQLEMERGELKSSLEEVKDVKSALERNQLELQTEVTNVKFQLKQEQENRRNANMMYNSSKDKLRRTEEQHQLEVQERQKVELTLRNLELEMRTLVNNMKQLEEDHSETQRLLAQERSARQLQENLLNSHLRKQQEIEDENRRNISRSTEALSQLTEASDREKELLQQTANLQEQLTNLRADLERSQASSSLKESHLMEENETLKEQLEDTRRDLKLNGEALTQTIYNYNNQVTTLKSELTMTATRLENEQQTRKTSETELESVRSRLAGAVKETELCLAAHTETEKALLREKEEHQRLKDKLSGEAASQREAVSSLSQKLSKAESRSNSLENEVHRATLQLTEKGLLLDVLQREKEQAAARVKELETALQAERELASRAGARQEAMQERLAQAQSEGMLLKQQLEESQNKGVAKERAVTDAQERFSDILSKLRSDCEERVQLVEERNKELAGKAVDLRDQIYKLEEEKSERETNLRQLQQELADSLKRLSMSEASLEVNTRYRSDLEEEKTRLLKDLDRLKGKLEESEDQYVQAERQMNFVKSALDEKGKELTVAAQKLQEALSTSAASDSSIKQLEDAVQRLEIENARLEAAAKQQSNKIEALQKGAHEATRVRSHLEDLVTNLQSSKMTLEDQLNREVQKQSMLSHTAQDSQALWEEELKSRSKLGLRLAELEKEKGELSTQMEVEKKKAKKVMEQKKSVDARLDQEMKRNTELQKEMYRLRTLLKTAKKKMRDQDAGRAEFGSPMSSLRMDPSRQSEGFGRMREKVEDLQVQLEKEQSRRSQLERLNGELKDQLSSMKSLNHSSDQQERSKRQLEEEVLDLRRRMEAAQMEQSHVEQYRRDAEDRARQEIQQKLEQVNLFLQSQAASQEALDQIKAANEANLRSQLEQKIRELEVELGRARTTHHDSINQRDSTRTELERYRQLHAEELRQRKSLTAKLERANSRLTEANSKLLNERSRSLISSSIANGSLAGPSLDVGSLGSPAHYGPLNRSLGLGLSFLSPVSEAQNSSVEDYLAKMQSELERNISKELNNATAELYVTSARVSTAGSASGAELDPLSTATQQYLEVLKKNNMI